MIKNLRKIGYLLLTFIMSVAAIGLANGQSLPTGFERWDTLEIQPLPVPADYWYTNNHQNDSIVYGSGGVTRTPDSYSGDYAVHLETSVDLNGNTVPAYISNDPEVWGEGIPFSGNPDSLTGYYKCNIMPGDTAKIYVILNDNGMWEGSGQMLFTAEDNRDEYARFAFKIDTNDNGKAPSNMQLVLGSAINWAIAKPGTWLQFDQLALKGDNLTEKDTLGNAGFERWYVPEPYQVIEPKDWETNNLYTEFFGDTSFTRASEDAYSGSYSALCISDTIPGVGHMGGPFSYLHNGRIGPMGPEGGMITNLWPDSITAYYKYDPGEPTDTALFGVINGSTMGGGPPSPENSSIQILLESNSYKKISFDLTSIKTDETNPDTVMVFISSSNPMSQYFAAGSRLWVDDIAIYPQSVQGIVISSENDAEETWVDSTLQFSIEAIIPDYALDKTIEWSVDEEGIASIDQNGLLTGLSEGLVTVTASAADGSGTTASLEITVSAIEGIREPVDKTRILDIYPVPASSVLTIESHDPLSGRIQLLDITGKTVLSRQVNKGQMFTLDISDLAGGLYFLRINTGDKVMTKKVVVE